MFHVIVTQKDFDYVINILQNLLITQTRWPNGTDFIYWHNGTIEEHKLAINILACSILHHEKDLSKQQCLDILSYMNENRDNILNDL